MNATAKKPIPAAVRQSAEQVAEVSSAFPNWPRHRVAAYFSVLERLPACAWYKQLRQLLTDADALMKGIDTFNFDLRPEWVAVAPDPLAEFFRLFGTPDLADEVAAVRVTLRNLTAVIESSLPPVLPAKPKAK